ncbi:MAG: hypothetical protein GXP19_03790 [Gammaproteobacteria bacterium]|nr:hypothetical protein [Gammaproteobacteria bacterium]
MNVQHNFLSRKSLTMTAIFLCLTSTLTYASNHKGPQDIFTSGWGGIIAWE